MSAYGFKGCGFCGEIVDIAALNEVQVTPTYADGSLGPAATEYICDACDADEEHAVLVEVKVEPACANCKGSGRVSDLELGDTFGNVFDCVLCNGTGKKAA